MKASTFGEGKDIIFTVGSNSTIHYHATITFEVIPTRVILHDSRLHVASMLGAVDDVDVVNSLQWASLPE